MAHTKSSTMVSSNLTYHIDDKYDILRQFEVLYVKKNTFSFTKEEDDSCLVMMLIEDSLERGIGAPSSGEITGETTGETTGEIPGGAAETARGMSTGLATSVMGQGEVNVPCCDLRLSVCMV
jgi:hypothetical protein